MSDQIPLRPAPPMPAAPVPAGVTPAPGPGAPAPGKFTVVDDVFSYTTKRGVPIVIDLDIPPDVFEKTQAPENESEEQQFAAVTEWLGPEVEEAYKVMGALERVRFLSTFFAQWQKAAELPLGESLSSSNSSGSTAVL